jgi:DNA-directed RNA polymerase subunit RPC12/RpoP
MPRKPRINLEKVNAALNTICTKCGYAIPPDGIRRIDSAQIKCPECGQRFTPGEQPEQSRDSSQSFQRQHDSFIARTVNYTKGPETDFWRVDNILLPHGANPSLRTNSGS